MSLLFALFSPGGEALPPAVAGGLPDRIEAACDWPRDRVLRHEVPCAAMLCLQRDAVPRFGRPRLDFGDGLAMLFAGRLDNRIDLAAELGLGDPAQLDDEDIAAAAYRHAGPGFARLLLGDFAIVLHDAAQRRLLLVRDHVGAMPLYRAGVGPFVAVSSCIEYLRLVPGIDLKRDEAWLADTLALAKRDAEQTAYRAIRAVPAAHVLSIDQAGERAQRYWSLPTRDRPLAIDPGEATHEFHRLFARAVACRLRSPGAVACELSAGLDSGSIAVTAGPILSAVGKTLHAFSHGLPDTEAARRSEALDDREALAPLLADNPGIVQEWITGETDSLVGTLRRTLARHGAPPRNDLNAAGEQLPDIMRERDIRVLLSGFGGDQLATTLGGGYVESLLEECDREALREHLVARFGALAGGARYWLYRSGIARIGLQRRAAAGVKAQASAIAGLGQPDFLARHGVSQRQQDRPLSGTMREREAAIMARPHIAYRLQDSGVGAAARGFEYRYPMLDIRLLEFAHNLPARLKYRFGYNRRMIREAMKGHLPESVRLRSDKGQATIPWAHLNMTLHADELTALFEAHRGDPRVTDYARIGPALETLDETRRNGDFGGPMVKKQIQLLALLCLWSERDG